MLDLGRAVQDGDPQADDEGVKCRRVGHARAIRQLLDEVDGLVPSCASPHPPIRRQDPVALEDDPALLAKHPLWHAPVAFSFGEAVLKHGRGWQAQVRSVAAFRRPQSHQEGLVEVADADGADGVRAVAQQLGVRGARYGDAVTLLLLVVIAGEMVPGDCAMQKHAVEVGLRGCVAEVGDEAMEGSLDGRGDLFGYRGVGPVGDQQMLGVLLICGWGELSLDL